MINLTYDQMVAIGQAYGVSSETVEMIVRAALSRQSVAVSPELQSEINEAAKAGRITFEPGWNNAAPQSVAVVAKGGCRADPQTQAAFQEEFEIPWSEGGKHTQLTFALGFQAGRNAAPAGDAGAVATSDNEIASLLRVYANNNGYSHNDYADTMLQAADEIERLTKHTGEPVAYLNLKKLEVGGMCYATKWNSTDAQSPVYSQPSVGLDETAICVGMDALRILTGAEPKNFTLDQVITALQCVKGAAHPAPAALTDRQIADMVNELRDIAVQFHDTQQLRERIAHVVVPLLKAAKPTMEDLPAHGFRLAYYVRHPDGSTSMADPQPTLLKPQAATASPAVLDGPVDSVALNLEAQLRAVLNERDALKSDLAKQETATKSANRDADMYANAWQRELVAYDGKIYNKRHHIDAMVKTTRAFINQWKAAEARVRDLEAAQPDTAAVRDAARPDYAGMIRKLCGYVENGSDTVVKIFQDDATRAWTVKVGTDNLILRTKTKHYHGDSFETAVLNAFADYVEP